MASLAAVAASATLASPASVSFSGLRPLRPFVQVATCPRLRLSRSRHGHSFAQGIRASQDKRDKDQKDDKKDKSSDDKKDKTFDEIRRIISEQLAVKPDTITPESKFSELGADSLDTVEIMMALEEKFDIQLEQEAGEKIQTVANAVDLIKEVIAAAK